MANYKCESCSKRKRIKNSDHNACERKMGSQRGSL